MPILSRPLASLCVAGALFGFALPADAALFDFENLPVTIDTTPFSLTSSGLTASFAAPADPGAFEVSYNSTSGSLPLFKGLQGGFLGSSPFTSLDLGSPLVISFSAPVTTLSLNFALGRGPGTLTLTTDTGGQLQSAGTVLSGYAYGEGTATFTGAAFRTVTLQANASTGLEVDNINATVAAATAVPEPASAALLIPGLIGAIRLGRRVRA